MSFYRSDTISQYKIILPRQSAWEIMNQLGKKNIVHIEPSLVPLLSKPFLSQVKRCEEALIKIHNIEVVLKERNIFLIRKDFSEDAFEEMFKLWDDLYIKNKVNSMAILNDFIHEVDHAWSYYQDLLKRSQGLGAKVSFMRQNLAVIKAGQTCFGRSFFTQNQQRVNEIGQVSFHSHSTVNFKCGVISMQAEMRFKKTVFRITKGNSLVTCVHFADVLVDASEQQKDKVAFFILFPSQNQNYFDKKLTKLVENFSDKKYEIPSKPGELQHINNSLQSTLLETTNLFNLVEQQIKQFLQKFSDHLSQSSYFRKHEYIKLYILKEKQLYENLNEMQLFNNFLQGSLFVRTSELELLNNSLMSIEDEMNLPAGQVIPVAASKIPTHFIRNDYTRSAQQIVETYGVPRYKEANPSFFTTVTFPFLFGVMFGDIAHGLIFFAFGLYMVLKRAQIEASGSFMKMLLPHRYLFTMMGFFAVYCGFIYNQFLSISLNLFVSCYNVDGVEPTQPIPLSDPEGDCVYSFGMDPIWSVSQNYLNYTNSLKMKIAVIIAVVHMTLGVFVKASNALFFKKWMDFFCQFIPQLAFMVLLFGYMDFLIIFKWLKAWPDTAVAPSIITTMINMPLKLGKTTDCCGGQPMWGTFGDTSQDQIQLIFVVVAVIAIPIMLLPKPLYEIYCSNKGYHKIGEQKELKDGDKLLQSSQSLDLDRQKSVENEEHDSSEIFVHQLIETIEYVLGCISNTASYLRLWALSLAHSQLSEVFFEKLVQGGIVKGYGGIPLMIFGFVCLAGVTFAVLLCMDSMQCFLHTLRLHWVEFQNKFYKGDGFAFMTYSFRNKINEELASISL